MQLETASSGIQRGLPRSTLVRDPILMLFGFLLVGLASQLKVRSIGVAFQQRVEQQKQY